jgi:hypothetical protein
MKLELDDQIKGLLLKNKAQNKDCRWVGNPVKTKITRWPEPTGYYLAYNSYFFLAARSGFTCTAVTGLAALLPQLFIT